MTYREGFSIAMKRLGKSDEEISKRLHMADEKTGKRIGPAAMKFIDEPMVLKPGATEEDVIQGFMNLCRLILGLSQEEYQSLVKESEERFRKQASEN